MRLIISEKANAAKKIAGFLAEGSVKDGKHRSVPHHTFVWKGEECVSVGLKGHVLNPEYPEEYSNWQKVEPSKLIDAEILKSISEKGVAEAIRSLSKKADRVVDRKSTRLNSSHANISYAVFCLKKKIDPPE